MATTVIERFVYALGLDVDQRSFDQGNTALDKLGGMVEKVAALAAAGAVAMVGLVKSTANEADEAVKAADALGLQVEQLQKLGHVADINGSSQKKMEMALERMIRRLSEARQGTGEAVGALVMMLLVRALMCEPITS